MNIRLLGLFLIASLLFSACLDDDGNPPIWGDLDNHIFVLNEGGFGSANGSLTAISRETGDVWDNIFEMVNEFKLGDVVHSMTIHNGKAYIVVNNSGKIEVADANTLKSEGTIDGLTSPRYFLPINDDKAYVTNYITDSGTTSLDVIDLKTNEVTKSIPTAWGEQMVMSDGKVFVGIMNTFDLMVIDPVTDEVIQTLPVSYAPNSLKVDRNGKVWVLSDGGYYNEDIPALRRIDPVTLQTEQVFAFDDANASPKKLAINSAGDKLYYLESGQVWRIDIEDDALPQAPFITSDDYSFYGLNIDPTNNNIYTTDVADYQSEGSVLYYRLDGVQIDKYDVGIIPGDFCFN